MEGLELLASLIQKQNELLEQFAGKDAPLGFGESTMRPRYIYCNRSQTDCLWYWLDDDRKVQPINASSLWCVVQALEFKEVERKGKPTWKLHLHVKADRSYILESGFDSTFSKSLMSMLAVADVEGLRKPVSIEVQAADSEEVIFCRLYVNGESVYAPYDENTHWKTVANKAIANVRAASGIVKSKENGNGTV